MLMAIFPRRHIGERAMAAWSGNRKLAIENGAIICSIMTGEVDVLCLY